MRGRWMRDMLTEEQVMIRDVVREFATGELGPAAHQVDVEARFPREAWPKLAALDLLGLAVPADAGGADAGDLTFVVAIEELARVCGSTAAALVAHAALGLGPIVAAGDDAQRRRWLADSIGGQRFVTLALSQAEASGDDLSIVASRRGDAWVLAGDRAAVL